LKIVFMGTPEFALPSLDMLVREGHEIAAVVTQPDKPKGRGQKLCCPPVKEYADKNGIIVLQPYKVKTPDFIYSIKALEPDLLVTAAYGKILPLEILNIPKYGCINVHASLLPEYRGAAPINWAIINGELKTGVTTMLTDIGMDTGDILLKKEMNIPDDMIAGELHDKLAVFGAECLKETLAKLKDNTLYRIPQQHEKASYAPMLKKDVGLISWGKPSREIHNLVRGTNPWPVAYTFYKEKRVKIWKTQTELRLENENDACYDAYQPGTICKRDKDGIFVKCGEGFIKILELQFDGCRKLCSDECWHNFESGESLG